MLRILKGSALSHKTETLYRYLIQKAIEHPEKRFIMLVPEQASLSVQEAFVSMVPNHALTNIDVLTFNRLAHKVFVETDEPIKTILDENGKIMLLRIAAKRHENEVPMLKRNLNKPGFFTELKSVVSELAEYNISADELKERLKLLNEYPNLQLKLNDIAVIYSEFLELIHQNFELAEERPVRLSKALDKWDDLKRTTFALDGFTGFTPPQYDVIGKLIMGAEEVCLSATIGSGRTKEENKEKEDLFYMTSHMISKVCELAIRYGSEIAESEEETEREVSNEIRHIEKNLFVYPVSRYGEETDRIRVCRLANPSQEVQFLTSQILLGIREGLHYNEMAVITGDEAGYEEELGVQFGAAGIPYFMDETKGLEENLLIRLILETFQVINFDFSYDDVVSYMKNPLIQEYLNKTISQESLSTYDLISEVENYLLALGIRGKSRYQKGWKIKHRSISEDKLPLINEVKDTLVAPIFQLMSQIKSGKTVREYLVALVYYFERLKTEEILEYRADRAKGLKEYMKEQEDRHIYQAVIRLFEQTEQILGEQDMDFSVFCDILQTGLSQMKLGIAPPTKDRLVIGDLKRTRLSGIKRLFILGANDDVFPRAGKATGLLSDRDREVLRDNELILSETVREESFHVQFYLYLLFTQPSESIMMTYSITDKDGNNQAPSFVVSQIIDLFGLEKAENISPEAIPVNTVEDGLRKAAYEIRSVKDRVDNGKPIMDVEERVLLSDESRFSKTFLAVLEECGRKREADPIFDGICYRYREEFLSPNSIDLIYGDDPETSVSSLEKYASCAFSHFLTYGLQLRERDRYQLDNTDFGTIYHFGVEEFFREISESGRRIDEVSESEASEIAARAIETATNEYGFAIFSDTARNKYLVERMKRIMVRTVNTLKYQWEQGAFTDTEMEVSYSGKQLKNMKLQSSTGRQASLKGRIDRIDSMIRDKEIVLKVLDYKSSRKDIDFSKVYYGLQMQLLIYMKAAEEKIRQESPESNVIPGGLYYYHIEDPIVEASEEDAENEIRKKLRLSGITNDREDVLEAVDRMVGESSAGSTVVDSVKRDKNGEIKSEQVMNTEQIEAMMDFTMKKAEMLEERILKGNISVKPYDYGGNTPCGYCEFKGICGFDQKIPGYTKNRMYKKTSKDILEEMIPSDSEMKHDQTDGEVQNEVD